MQKVGLGGEGVLTLLAKQEDFGIMYAPFCPYHAHCFHLAPCKKWLEKVEFRKAATARTKAQGQKRREERAAKFTDASASTNSNARF